VPVGVDEERALPASNKEWVAADAGERPHRRVHAARDARLRPGEELLAHWSRSAIRRAAVGEDEVGPGPLDRAEVLGEDRVAVKPAVRGGGFDIAYSPLTW